MRSVPLIASAALAVSACSGASTTDTNELVVGNLTVENLIVDEALPAATNDVSDAPSQPQAVESAPTATAPAARNGESSKSTTGASGRTEAAPKTKPAPEPEPDPHAGHDMNNMQ